MHGGVVLVIMFTEGKRGIQKSGFTFDSENEKAKSVKRLCSDSLNSTTVTLLKWCPLKNSRHPAHTPRLISAEAQQSGLQDTDMSSV